MKENESSLERKEQVIEVMKRGCSLDELMAFHGAPVLLGEKTGNLFSIRRICFERMRNRFNEMAAALRPMGICLEILRERPKSVLIYVYRPAMLEIDLDEPRAKAVLAPLCYDRSHILERLRERVAGEEFPHEIGLFLGYPPEDVCGFIENRGENSKYCGCWKVYGDVESARKTFARYDQCQALLWACVQRGQEIEEVVRSAERKDA